MNSLCCQNFCFLPTLLSYFLSLFILCIPALFFLYSLYLSVLFVVLFRSFNSLLIHTRESEEKYQEEILLLNDTVYSARMLDTRSKSKSRFNLNFLFPISGSRETCCFSNIILIKCEPHYQIQIIRSVNISFECENLNKLIGIITLMQMISRFY